MNKIHLKNVELRTYKLKSKNNEIVELLKFKNYKDKKKMERENLFNRINPHNLQLKSKKNI